MGRDAESSEDTRPIIMASDDPDEQRTSPERDSLHREENTKVILLQSLFVESGANYGLAFSYGYSPAFMACIVPFHIASFSATQSYLHSYRRIPDQRSRHTS